MSQSSNKELRFSIDETIWLKEGQEAEEILSLALEPDITIEENRSHVLIKGGLKLTGEYKPVDQVDGEINQSGMSDHLSFRTIDEISLSDDGIATIEHTFPVDITIPTNRINDLEDVYVTVESFDYDIPERGCLQLLADISISGLVEQESNTAHYENNDAMSEASYDDSVPFQREEEDDSESPYQMFHAESYKEKEDREDADDKAPDVGLKKRHEEAVEEVSEVKPASQDNPLHSLVNENKNMPKSKVTTKPTETKVEEVELELELEAHGKHDDEFEKKVEIQAGKRHETPEQDEAADEVIAEEKPQKKSHHDENALYLTKMLSNEEEQFAKVRMCIVQQGESLDKISERYRIPVTTILRTNRLESDTVDEGQVLYIPVPVANK